MSGDVVKVWTCGLVRALALVTLVLAVLPTAGRAATARLQTADGLEVADVELGTRLQVEIAVEAPDEAVTGVAFFVAVDAEIFDVVEASVGADGRIRPFEAGGMLAGVDLLNRVERLDDEWILGYVAAAGVQRQGVADGGVAARFVLEAKRRPTSGTTTLRLIERGHDRVSHYLRRDEPGVEQRFTAPLGRLELTLSGFRIAPLPDLKLSVGEEAAAFDLDDFARVDGGTVLWTVSRQSEIDVRIDARTNEVSIAGAPGFVGTRPVVFRALENGSGLSVADTIEVTVIAPPVLADLPPRLEVDEDVGLVGFALDPLVSDLDDADEELVWSVAAGEGIQAMLGEGRAVDFVPDTDFFGSVNVSLAVSDGDGQETLADLVVDVLPINDAPVARRPVPVYPAVGGALALDAALLALDVDDPVQQLDFVFTVEGDAALEAADGVVQVRAGGPGRSVARYSVRDTAGAFDEGRIVVVALDGVEGVAPKVLPPPGVRLPAGGTTAFGLEATDDGPAEALEWDVFAGEGVSARLEGTRLVLAAAEDLDADSHVGIRVRDALGNRDSLGVVVEFLPAAAVVGPLLDPPPAVGVLGGGETVLDLDGLVGAGADAGALQWSVVASQGVEAEVDPEAGVLRLRALSVPAFIGLRAEDTLGNATETTIPVLILEPGGPPQVAPLPALTLERSASEGRLDLDLFVFDADDRAAELEWEATAESGIEVELDPATHLLRVRRAPDSPFSGQLTQVLLRVRDTDGFERSVLVDVRLPPLFELLDLPPLSLFATGGDTSLVLNEFVVNLEAGSAVHWEAESAQRLRVEIDPASSRVYLSAAEGVEQGREIVTFIATDQQGRHRVAPVEVEILGKGLQPQIRPFPILLLEDGGEAGEIVLDDFVVDDDPDSALVWSAVAPAGIEAIIEPQTRLLRVRSDGAAAGLARVEVLVRDPAGNSDVRLIELQVRHSGEAPVILPLPQPLIAPGEEARLSLDLFIEDADTAPEDIAWEVTVDAGVAARIESRRLFISLPLGQQGTRRLLLSATDPQGNRAEATLQLVIVADDQPPSLRLESVPHPDGGAVLLRVYSDEILAAAPLIEVDGQALDALADGDAYSGRYILSPLDGSREVTVRVEGRDNGGNVAVLQELLAVRPLESRGGVLPHDGAAIVLNLPDAAAASGRLALIRRLPAGEGPPAEGIGTPVYSVAIGPQGGLLPRLTVRLRAPDNVADAGVWRWEPDVGAWEELPTVVDVESGWLSVVVERLGLFRVGQVETSKRRDVVELAAYPNPFDPGLGPMQVVYRLETSSPARLTLYNALGQRVRLLVDRAEHAAGIWVAEWDGRDQGGGELANGLYFLEIRHSAGRHRLPMTLLH